MIWITYLVLVFFPILVTWFVAFLDAQKQSWSVTSFSLATGVGCWPWLALGMEGISQSDMIIPESSPEIPKHQPRAHGNWATETLRIIAVDCFFWRGSYYLLIKSNKPGWYLISINILAWYPNIGLRASYYPNTGFMGDVDGPVFRYLLINQF